MKSSNPVLRENMFKNMSHNSTNHMTIEGTMNKFLLFLLVLLVGGYLSWSNAVALADYILPILIISFIGTLIIAIIISFKMHLAQSLGYLYALMEGFLLGLISAFFEMAYPGIVIQAIGLTFATAFIMLFIYKNRWIKVTEKFKIGMFCAIGAIMLIYFISMILSLFGINMPMIHENGPVGIIFSIIVVVIAALTLILDFDMIENLSNQKVPKYMESYGAFALIVTLVWLYLEILKLLSKLQSRD
jgi:uncharacterized YccA/Bax inhibitor family protein